MTRRTSEQTWPANVHTDAEEITAVLRYCLELVDASLQGALSCDTYDLEEYCRKEKIGSHPLSTQCRSRRPRPINCAPSPRKTRALGANPPRNPGIPARNRCSGQKPDDVRIRTNGLG